MATIKELIHSDLFEKVNHVDLSKNYMIVEEVIGLIFEGFKNPGVEFYRLNLNFKNEYLFLFWLWKDTVIILDTKKNSRYKIDNALQLVYTG